jgi:hypothetical protein
VSAFGGTLTCTSAFTSTQYNLNIYDSSGSDNSFFGHRDPDTFAIDGTCTLYGVDLNFDNAGLLGLTSVVCTGASVSLFQGNTYLNKLSFTTSAGATNVFGGTLNLQEVGTSSSNGYYGYYTGSGSTQVWYNPIVLVQSCSGLIEAKNPGAVATGSFTIGSYVVAQSGNTGAITVDGGCQLSIVGRPNTATGAMSLEVNHNATVNLYAGGSGGIYCAYDIGIKGGTVNVKRDLVNYQDGVYSAHFSAPLVTFTDSTGGLGTGYDSALYFEPNDALVDLDCGLSLLSLNYVEVVVNVDYMLWDANTIKCYAASFPSSGTEPSLTVVEADGNPDTGSWKIIDTGGTHSGSFNSFNLPINMTTGWSSGDLYLNHS